MTDPDLQKLAELWTDSDAGEQEAFEALARRARIRGRVFAYLDVAAVTVILAVTLLGIFMKPNALSIAGALALIATTLFVTHKRRQIKQMTRELDTASRQTFLATSISNAAANLRRTRLSLAFFPLGIGLALLYKMAVLTGGRADLMPAAFVDWLQSPRGVTTTIALLLLLAWGFRTAHRLRLELGRLEALRDAYAEETRLEEEAGG